MWRCLSKPKSLELEFDVPHVDDFPRKELNRLIESARREPESDPNKLAKIAIGLRLSQQRSDDVIRQFETQGIQTILTSSYQSNFKYGRKLCLVGAASLVLIYLLLLFIPNLPENARSWILSPCGLLLVYGFTGERGMQRGLQVWKKRKLRLMFLEALFHTNSEFTAWSEQNPGKPSIKKIREVCRSTGLPFATVSELHSLFELLSQTSEYGAVWLPERNPKTL